MSKLLSVIVPMYQEELVVNSCYDRIKKVLISIPDSSYEILFVNDGSTDNTYNILKSIAEKDKCVKIIDFSRNFGHQAAVTAGIFNAKGDALIIIDSDMQDPPELIPQMVDKWLEGFDIVYGTRKKRAGETFFKLFTAKCFYRFLDKVSEIKIPKDTGDFRLIDRRVAESFKELPEHNIFLRGMFSWLGFKQTSLEYYRDERLDGESKYSLKKMVSLAMDGILSFSFLPIKLLSTIGVILIFISAGFLIASTVAISNKAIASFLYLFLISTIFSMSGIQLLAMGILGEYIGRTYNESRNRPLYIVQEYINL